MIGDATVPSRTDVIPGFAALQHGKALAARGLDDFDLDIRKALCVAMEELRQHAFDVLRRAGHLENAGITVTKQLRLLGHGAGEIEQDAAAR